MGYLLFCLHEGKDCVLDEYKYWILENRKNFLILKEKLFFIKKGFHLKDIKNHKEIGNLDLLAKRMDFKQQKLTDDLLINIKLLDNFKKENNVLSEKNIATNLFLINLDESHRKLIILLDFKLLFYIL